MLGESLINFMILFLEVKLFKFRRVGSKLFHSIVVEGERVFEEFVSNFKQGMLSRFLVSYAWVFSGIHLKRYWGLSFLYIL